MLAKIMKFACIAALVLTLSFWRIASNYQLALNMLLFVGSLAVFAQAVRAREHAWAGGFLLAALVFNPVLLLRPAALKPPLMLSVPSITGRSLGSSSLGTSLLLFRRFALG